jgi:hypothetical protein
MDEVTLPAPPEGFKYALVRDTVNTVRDKDPTELTPRQLATLRYREKNREKILEEKRQRYQEKKRKEEKVSKLGTTPS